MAILFSFSHYMTLSTDAYEINRDSIFNEKKKKNEVKTNGEDHMVHVHHSHPSHICSLKIRKKEREKPEPPKIKRANC